MEEQLCFCQQLAKTVSNTDLEKSVGFKHENTVPSALHPIKPDLVMASSSSMVYSLFTKAAWVFVADNCGADDEATGGVTSAGALLPGEELRGMVIRIVGVEDTG